MDLTFVDTNILIYAHDRGNKEKYEIAKATLQRLWDTDKGALSTQVLQEFYAVATRKLKPAMSHREARQIVADYSEWCVMPTDTQLLVSASALAEKHQLSWWDSLIIEAALRSGASTLLSEDLQDGRSFGTQRLSEQEAAEELGAGISALLGPDDDRGVEVIAVRTGITSLADPPNDAYDVYLRLHLLSYRLVQPNTVNLDGIFGLLSNVVWTNHGPCQVEGFSETRLRLRARGAVTVHGIDKFPRMVDYVIPTGVRIADADRVRLGAHLSSGTTVMHEGFVNYNAGTLGASMVEGRISQGVVVGDGSDIGGGASVMGTLSGGGKETIAIGERCLLGANAGIGISLGDDCVVEAGLYVTAGTKVSLPDGRLVKAKDLSGSNGLLLRRNSSTGAVEAVLRSGTGIDLNAALHAND